MRSRDRLGFTLVEMLIALVVTGVVLVGVITAANAQHRAFFGGQKVRAAQNTARAALLYLEQKLPLAGFGMDPALALDLGTWYTSGSTGFPCPSQMGTCPRDSTSSSDELVFYARNPAYWVHATDFSQAPQGNAWRFTEITDTHIKVVARAGDVFRKGQILQAVCPGETRYAYFTVSATTPATAAGELEVSLEDKSDGDPFRRQDVATGAAMGDKCFKPAAPAEPTGRLFLIDRYRFHVRPVSQGGGAPDDPYLVLDQGVDADEDLDVDADDEVLVAQGIEILQVGYAFADASNQTAGATAGTAISWKLANDDQSSVAGDDVVNTIVRTKFPGATPPSGESAYYPSSFYRYRYDDPIRRTAHQANIRAVRLGLSARAPTPDPDSPATYRIETGFTLLNLDTPPSWIKTFADARGGDDRFQRFRIDATVNLPNMLVRSITHF